MSSGSESDDEYIPEENPVPLSEEESADDETEKQYENEVDQKKKRKIVVNHESKGKKKRKTRHCEKAVIEKPEQKSPEEELDPKELKKKEDDLWAMFLDGTETKPKPKETNKDSTKPESVEKVEVKETIKANTSERDKRIFEFAGETIVVENDVIKERIKCDDSPGTAKVVKPPVRAPAGGLSGLLGQIDKKNKLSTLEKSKLDWTTFKKDEGIEEEITSHNKGKQGYLERRDFLERADYRQYEIERDLRTGRRSNR